MNHFGLQPISVVEKPAINKMLGATIVFVNESVQPTGSFKDRAAQHVVQEAKAMLYMTASSGNFGAALAYAACTCRGRECVVVMPETSSRIKIESVKSYGAHVLLIDTTKISRQQKLDELFQKNPGSYITNAYDNELIIEGNSSLGRELATLQPFPDVIIAPVGGGGLCSGIIVGLQEAGRKNFCVIGAEPLIANDASRSLQSQRLKKNSREPQTIADGARTLSLGELNWPILKDGMERIIEVTEAQICAAVRTLFFQANIKAEPTGALAFAALLSQPEAFKGQRVCCIVSGGNVDPLTFMDILQG